jgi:ABC-type multidrug transport system fused ATPase/permease subunit
MHADEELEAAHHHEPETKPSSGATPLIDKEERETGGVSLAVYLRYGKYAGGIKILVSGAVAMSLFMVFASQMNITIAEWTADSPSNQVKYRAYYIGMFVAAAVLTHAAVVTHMIIFWTAGLRAAKKIFAQMMQALLNAPINAFYEITPIGRILNRLSKDQAQLDYRIFASFCTAIANAFRGSFTIGICVYAVPWVGFALPVVFFCVYWI